MIQRFSFLSTVIATFESQSESFKLKSNVAAVKHGGGSIMLNDCFTVSGNDDLHKGVGMLKTDDHFKMVQLHRQSATRRLKLRHITLFQQYRLMIYALMKETKIIESVCP